MSIIKISVDKYVKQILLTEFGSEPIFASQNSIVGIMIRPMVVDRSINFKDIRSPLKETISIKLPYQIRGLRHNKHEESYYFIDPSKKSKVEYGVKKFCDFIIINSIRTSKFNGLPTMKSIDAVYKQYNFTEEEASIDSIRKLYERFINKQQNKKKCVQSCPSIKDYFFNQTNLFE